MPKPKTAKLTLEIVNDDGSKEIITTEDLDASRLKDFPHTEKDYDHVVMGMEDPFYDEDDYFTRRDQWVHDFLRVPKPDSHFFMRLRLEPVDKTKHVYHIRKVEAPDTSVVMIFNANRPVVCNFNELKAQRKAEAFGTGPDAPIYFLLDIP